MSDLYALSLTINFVDNSLGSSLNKLEFDLLS